MRWGSGAMACAVAVGLCAGAAQAHEFECTKTANGQSVYTITEYPADVTWSMTARNIHPTSTSVALGLEDPLLEGMGFTFDPAPPVSVPVGQALSYTYQEHFDSAEACLKVAGSDGLEDDNIDNTFKVIWDQGEDQCSARVVCTRPPPPPEGGATRTMGFFMTHLEAMQSCLDEGAVDLGPGFDTITTLEDAEGLFWASTAKYESGENRSDLDKARYLLARQTLVAVCNQRLFGTTPTPPDLIDQALAALNGQVCSDILDLAEQVDAYNNSGDSEDFPSGFVAGPATPQEAMDLAEGNDPSVETSDSCVSPLAPLTHGKRR